MKADAESLRKMENWPRGKFGINKQAAVQHEGSLPTKKKRFISTSVSQIRQFCIFYIIRCHIEEACIRVWMIDMLPKKYYQCFIGFLVNCCNLAFDLSSQPEPEDQMSGILQQKYANCFCSSAAYF